MGRPQEALRRRIAPAVAITLDLVDDDGSKFQRTLRLCFDFNAFALIEEHTGIDMTGVLAWKKLTPSVLSVMFWAAALACQPEYAGEEGLGVIRSYMDVGNEDLIGWKLFEAYAAALPEEQRKLLLETAEKIKRGENPTQPPTGKEGPAETA